MTRQRAAGHRPRRLDRELERQRPARHYQHGQRRRRRPPAPRRQIRRLLAEVRRQGALLKAQNARLDRLQRQQHQVARLAAEITQLKQLLGAHQSLTPAK